MKKKMTQAERIRLYALIHECSVSTARKAIFKYDATGKYPDNLHYKRKTKEDCLDKFGITLVRDLNEPSGWSVYQNGKKRTIGKTYRNLGILSGHKTEYYRFTYADPNKKPLQPEMFLHHAVYLSEIGPIEPNIVIHHSDKNSLNNDPGNLEPQTRPEHSKNHSTGTNQYTYR